MQEEFTWKATIDENVGNKDLGLKFEDFKAQPNVFYYNEGDSNIEDKIETFGTLTVTSLEDSEVVFECDADDGKIKGEVKNPIGAVEFNEGLNFFTVECQYNGEDFELSGKAQQGYTLRLKADYGFSGMGYLNIYTIKDDVLQRELRRNKGNKNVIFANVVDDKNLDKVTGEVEATYSGGPVKLVLFSNYNQPFTEKGLGSPYYTTRLILERDNWWEGTLKEIKDIYLYIPQEIEIEEEESKFENIGEDEYQFKIYRLKKETLDDLNSRCLDEFNVFDLNCWSGSNIATSARLIVNDVEDKVSETYIWAKVDYEYETDITEVIRFIKQSDLIA